MTINRLPDYLGHMHQAIADALGFTEGMAQYAEIPWRSMRGMRNRIAHGYFDIDLAVVWDTLQTAIPALKAQLDAIKD
jgi:uncharacterized protein YutE (UPF0331/DUF86 family)